MLVQVSSEVSQLCIHMHTLFLFRFFSHTGLYRTLNSIPCVMQWVLISFLFQYCCFYSVAKSCLTLCDPTDCSTPGFPVLHYLFWVCSNSCPLSQWYHTTISSSVAHFSCPQSFPASGSFPVNQLSALGGQSIGASALASVLPVNIQGLFPLGLISLISLLSKGLLRVFSKKKKKKKSSPAQFESINS